MKTRYAITVVHHNRTSLFDAVVCKGHGKVRTWKTPEGAERYAARVRTDPAVLRANVCDVDRVTEADYPGIYEKGFAR